MSDKILQLDTRFQPLAHELLLRLVEAYRPDGYIPLITDARRSLAKQKELYGKGRTVVQLQATKSYTAEESRKYAKPKEKKVTWTLDSYHIRGLAVDIAFTDKKGKLTYNVDWSKYGKICKDLGLEWGGTWKKTPDKPHAQLNVKPMEAPDIPAIEPWRSDVRRLAQERGIVGDMAGFQRMDQTFPDRVLAAILKSQNNS